MSLLHIPQATGDSTEIPGTWRPLRTAGGIRTATFICPQCGRWALLDHTIHPDGTIEPSVACPTPGCQFHQHIVLDGWEPG